MISIAGLISASKRLAPLWWLVLAGCFVADFAFNLHAGIGAYDFKGTIWQAGRDILHGHSPYPPPDASALAKAGNPAVYPAPTLVLASPLGLLPFAAAAILWDLCSVVALLAALRIVGVRDWRVYAVVFFSFPVASSLELGQIDALLALGCALAWRWRHKGGVRLAACLAALVVAKLLLWPLLVWAFVSGRRREAVGATIGAAALALAGWTVIGFKGFTDYPRLLSTLSDAFGTKGYSLMAAGTRLGLSVQAARLVPLVALAALIAVCVLLSRKGRAQDAFIVAVAAGIVGSPILWLHYLMILLVAIAAKKKAFGPFWAIPIALWLTPAENPGSGFDFAIGFVLLAVLLVAAVRRDGAPAAAMRWVAARGAIRREVRAGAR